MMYIESLKVPNSSHVASIQHGRVRGFPAREFKPLNYINNGIVKLYPGFRKKVKECFQGIYEVYELDSMQTLESMNVRRLKEAPLHFMIMPDY